jgi:hypothetical protein
MRIQIRQIFIIIGIILVGMILGIFVAKAQIAGAATLIVLPFVIAYLIAIFKFPALGLYSVLFCCFFLNGLGRYVNAGPLGLLIDIFLILTLLAEFFKSFDSGPWPDMKRNPILIAIYVWGAYCLMEFFNPEAKSKEAWFYAMRAVILYLVLIVMLGIILMRTEKHLDRVLRIWTLFSVVATLWGARQLFVGLDRYEQAWMDSGNAITHILFGKLRVFSFYSDAGQFGAAMGHIGLICILLAIAKLPTLKRIFYIVCGLFCLWGMAISGTRGALFVVMAGFMCYLGMSKNYKMLVVGGMIAVSFFVMLKYTKIGQSNYQINRMRTGLDPNDPSLQLRLINQAKLRGYLASRPIGGGIGSAGFWGIRFSPGTFLAVTALDSWYVKIWAECGVVGLYVHLGMLLTFMIYFGLRLWYIPPCLLRDKMVALYSGMFGILVACYGNQLLGQLPTNVVVYLSISFLYVFTKEEYYGKKIDTPHY